MARKIAAKVTMAVKPVKPVAKGKPLHIEPEPIREVEVTRPIVLGSEELSRLEEALTQDIINAKAERNAVDRKIHLWEDQLRAVQIVAGMVKAAVE